MKVNRRKILKYITSRHNLILCRFLVKSFFSFYYCWFSIFILILSSLFFYSRFVSCSFFVQCRFSVYRTNFGTTEWKFQRLCRSRCNPTRASHPITFVLFDAWSGRFIRTISTRNATSTCTGQGWNYISISSKRWNIASHRLVFSMHTQMKWIQWFDNIEHPLTSFFCLSNDLFLPLRVSQHKSTECWMNSFISFYSSFSSLPSAMVLLLPFFCAFHSDVCWWGLRIDKRLGTRVQINGKLFERLLKLRSGQQKFRRWSFNMRPFAFDQRRIHAEYNFNIRWHVSACNHIRYNNIQ